MWVHDLHVLRNPVYRKQFRFLPGRTKFLENKQHFEVSFSFNYVFHSQIYVHVHVRICQYRDRTYVCIDQCAEIMQTKLLVKEISQAYKMLDLMHAHTCTRTHTRTDTLIPHINDWGNYLSGVLWAAWCCTDVNARVLCSLECCEMATQSWPPVTR